MKGVQSGEIGYRKRAEIRKIFEEVQIIRRDGRALLRDTIHGTSLASRGRILRCASSSHGLRSSPSTGR